jgi:hypothetical protein
MQMFTGVKGLASNARRSADRPYVVFASSAMKDITRR